SLISLSPSLPPSPSPLSLSLSLSLSPCLLRLSQLANLPAALLSPVGAAGHGAVVPPGPPRFPTRLFRPAFTRNLQPSTCNVVGAVVPPGRPRFRPRLFGPVLTRNLQPATFNLQPSTCNLQLATCLLCYHNDIISSSIILNQTPDDSNAIGIVPGPALPLGHRRDSRPGLSWSRANQHFRGVFAASSDGWR